MDVVPNGQWRVFVKDSESKSGLTLVRTNNPVILNTSSKITFLCHKGRVRCLLRGDPVFGSVRRRWKDIVCPTSWVLHYRCELRLRLRGVSLTLPTAPTREGARASVSTDEALAVSASTVCVGSYSTETLTRSCLCATDDPDTRDTGPSTSVVFMI